MKRKIFIVAILAITLLFCGCKKNDVGITVSTNDNNAVESTNEAASETVQETYKKLKTSCESFGYQLSEPEKGFSGQYKSKITPPDLTIIYYGTSEEAQDYIKTEIIGRQGNPNVVKKGTNGFIFVSKDEENGISHYQEEIVKDNIVIKAGLTSSDENAVKQCQIEAEKVFNELGFVIE